MILRQFADVESYAQVSIPTHYKPSGLIKNFLPLPFEQHQKSVLMPFEFPSSL